MLKHEDYDDHTTFRNNYKLPAKVESISVSYDGGRLYISVNGVEAYKSFSGTRDCTITVDRK